jgi:hypothetical protein
MDIQQNAKAIVLAFRVHACAANYLNARTVID